MSETHRSLGFRSPIDVIVALYNRLVSWNHITLPNKLFEANDVWCTDNYEHSDAEIVNETRCGVIVDYDNIPQVKECIVNLRDNPELRKKLGENGRQAYLRKYNWYAMEQKFNDIYSQLVQK